MFTLLDFWPQTTDTMMHRLYVQSPGHSLSVASKLALMSRESAITNQQSNILLRTIHPARDQDECGGCTCYNPKQDNREEGEEGGGGGAES